MDSQNKGMEVVGMVDIKEGWCIKIVEGGPQGDLGHLGGPSSLY